MPTIYISPHFKLASQLSFAFLLAACASKDPDNYALTSSNDYLYTNGEAPTTTYELPVPIVQELTPTYVAAGDTLTAYGSGFVPKRYGYTSLRLLGNFVNKQGASKNIDYTVKANYINSGKVSFTFEPAEAGSFGEEMGSFDGYVWAINHGNDGAMAEQEEEPAKFTVATKPSIVVNSIYPMKKSCKDPLLKRSLENTPIGLDVSLIGLKNPENFSPITVDIIYMDLATASEAPCPISQLDLPGCSVGDSSVVHRDHREINSSYETSFTISDIDFGPLPDGVLQSDGMISIRATDGETTLQRTVTVTMYNEPFIVEYDGSVEVAEIYAPEAVSGCVPGGEYGSSLSYNEGHSDSRSRSCSLSIGLSAKIPYVEKILGLSFGMSVNASVSSSDSHGLSINRHVLANQYGVVYRQTQRLLRRGDIVEYSECGEKNVIGEAQLTDWSWAPDIAITHNGVCPPLPPSNLPPAKCYINCD